MPPSHPAVVHHEKCPLKQQHIASTFGVEVWCFPSDQHPHPQPAPEPSLPQLKLSATTSSRLDFLSALGQASQPGNSKSQAQPYHARGHVRLQPGAPLSLYITRRSSAIFSHPPSSPSAVVILHSTHSLGHILLLSSKGPYTYFPYTKASWSQYIIIIPPSSADSQPLGSVACSCATAVYFPIPHKT